jgi:hypothetical protein
LNFPDRRIVCRRKKQIEKLLLTDLNLIILAFRGISGQRADRSSNWHGTFAWYRTRFTSHKLFALLVNLRLKRVLSLHSFLELLNLSLSALIQYLNSVL